MPTITYHVTTDNGKHVNIEANSAGDACGTVMRRFKGCKIIECFAGNDEGRVTYDIPPHEAIPKTPKVKAKKPVQTQLFS